MDKVLLLEELLKDSKVTLDNGGSVLVIVDKTIQDLMDHIGKETRIANDEYGVYLKADYISHNQKLYVVVGSEYDLPPQEVTPAAIKFGRDRVDGSFNAVIHRHPETCLEFSSTDEDSINANFKVSLLYVKTKGIFRANVNVNMEHYDNPIAIRTNNVFVL